MRILRLILWFIPVLASAGVVGAQATLPRLEPGDCQFVSNVDSHYSAYDNMTCGFLVVPENRANPDGNRVRLHYAVFHALGSNRQPDPIVYLDGGPGGASLPGMPWTYYAIGEPYNQDRDIIFFDQRGTGYSRPTLDCPEVSAMEYELLDENLSSEENRSLIRETLHACRERIESRGVNVVHYNSVENAADLEDLRQMLGYGQWNLYGISYGTRLALTAMRDYPNGVRSAIIDSVLPLEVSLYDDQPTNLERALNVLFLDCTLNAECNARYPRLGTVFYELVARLNAEPGTARINHPLTNVEYTVRVDGDQLIGLAFGALYRPDIFRLLPKLIYDVRDGNFRLLASTLESILDDRSDFAMGMHFAVQCNEETPFLSPESVQASLDANPTLGSFFYNQPNTGSMIMSVCEGWTSVMPSPAENAPVVSPIPTLVAAGQYDPITPPHWAYIVHQSLPNSLYYEFPGMGHGATVQRPCPVDIVTQFLNNPQATPVSTCIESMSSPQFLIVDDNLELVPFEDATLRLRSLRPAAWRDRGEGDFVRSEADVSFLRFFRFPDAGSDYLLRYLAAEFDVYDRPTPLENRPSNGFFWQIYEFRRGDTYIHAAITDRQGESYWVLLLSTEFERDQLYNEVFVPAVDALTGM